MMLQLRSILLCSLAAFTAYPLGVAPPKDAIPAKDADPQTDRKDPTKPRYVKADDPKLIAYAKSMYLNDREVTGTGHDNVRQWFQEKEQAARGELEAYKAAPDPEKAVIRYLESKIKALRQNNFFVWRCYTRGWIS
jgi:hypothetical protein